MPPVRWKLFTVTAIYVVQMILHADAQMVRDTVMTSDGWRPIIGTNTPHFYDVLVEESENMRSEFLSTPPTQTYLPTTVAPSPTHYKKPTRFRGSVKPSHQGNYNQVGLHTPGRKNPPHSKNSHLNPYYALPTHGANGPHVPLNAVTHTRQSQIGQIKKHPSNKPYIQPSYNSKRNAKPIRVPTSTHGYRDDIFTASATSGAYVFNQSPSNIKTRETIGLGLPVNNQYSINQPHAHIEYSNRFNLPNDGIFQQYNPVQGFIFPKHSQINDVNYQNDEYTRNLVPPPSLFKNKDTNQIQEPNIPENVIVQLPAPYQFSLQKVQEPVTQIQVTKEKLNVFHNNIPPNYSGDYVDYDFHSMKKPIKSVKPITYEVTEGKIWEETPEFSIRPRKPTKPPAAIEVNPPFLPTPYRVASQAVVPTSPTQSEVSTIFTKLSKLEREKHTTQDPLGFNAKEVSTHYPILGKPVFEFEPQIANEITTSREEVVPTSPRTRPHRRRRPEHRRTTTTTTTTTTEEPSVYDGSKTIEYETGSIETERPIRQRRPMRHRTTTPSSSEIGEETPSRPLRGRNRYRNRIEEVTNYELMRRRVRPTKTEIVTEPPQWYQLTPESFEAVPEKSEEFEEVTEVEAIELELPERHYITELPTTTEKPTTTNLVLPENEVEATEPIIEEITTTTVPSTTTSTTTTTTGYRIRKRPLKFDNSNRPRFSVKEYRQKLSHYSTVAPEPQRSTERVRLPVRLRRPTIAPTHEEETETARTKFVPKEPRHTATTEDDAIITEKSVKAVNTRLRPFGRLGSTTAATTTTSKVSIKPNLFSRRRPPMLTLRSKIYKQRNGTETTTEKVTTEDNDVKESTTDEDLTTQSSSRDPKTTEYFDDVDIDSTTEADISKIDYLYSQRVSDLTSSAKNDYNTPGLFKSVAPTSRRIPNHFTIATDDPILPIEAFFPNLKMDKDS